MAENNGDGNGSENGTKMEGSKFKEDAKQNLRGIFIIAKSDIGSHLKSPRMAVLMIIFILTIFSGAYVFSGMAANFTQIKPPEFLVWTFMGNFDDGSLPNDVLVITTDIDGNIISGVEISTYNLKETLVDRKTTDQQGRTILYNSTDEFLYIDSRRGDYSDRFRPLVSSTAQYFQIGSQSGIRTQVQAQDLDGDNVKDDIIIIVLDTNFQPVKGAFVEHTNKNIDNPYSDRNGIVKDHNYLRGKHEFTIQLNSKSITYDVEVINDDNEIASFLNLRGPDEVLMTIATIFMGLIIPIIAIGISFDSISREKISKSVIFLLSKPIGKRSIAIGKFLGSLIALVIPLTLISLVGVAIIASITKESPSGGFVAGFIIATIAFIAIFVLLQQIFSTLAKTTGNAILAGIAIWLFYYIFWSLIVIGVTSAMGHQFLSTDYFRVAYKMALLSPNETYSLIINVISTTSSQELIGIPKWAPFASFFVWFIILFILAIELFRKKPFL